MERLRGHVQSPSEHSVGTGTALETGISRGGTRRSGECRKPALIRLAGMTSDAGPGEFEFPPRGQNPLLSDEPETWDLLLDSVQPASILLLIHQRMSVGMRDSLTAEDIWQDTLLHAWTDRERFEWRGIASFRRWLIQIAMHRIHDAADRAGAEKRGAGRPAQSFSALAGNDGSSFLERLGRLASTTPSRLAIYREQAACMQQALERLPEELRDVVRLRLFEELTMEEVAERTGLGLSGVRHRFRKGATLYEEQLRDVLGSRFRRPPRRGPEEG